MAGPAPVTFEDLASLDDRTLQIVLRQLDHPTLVTALRGAAPAVVDAVLRNVSQRASQRLREDIAIAAGEEAAQRAAEARQVIASVLTTLYERQAVQQHDTGKPRPSLLADQLTADPGTASAASPAPVRQGSVQDSGDTPAPPETSRGSERGEDVAVAPEPVRPPPPAALPQVTEPPLPSIAPQPRTASEPVRPTATPQRPPPLPSIAPSPPVQASPAAPAAPLLARPPKRSTPWVRDPAAVGARLADWILLVRRSGPLALDAQESEIEVTSSLGRHLRLGVELIVDGEKPEKAQERLDAHAEEEGAALAAALDLITEGLLAIQAGVAPAELAAKLGVTLTPRDAARLARATEGAAEPETWLDDPVSAIGAMTAWSRVAQRSGLVALEGAAAAVDASTDLGEHARAGLLLIVDGQDPGLVRDVLDTNRDTVVAAFRQAAAMADAGLWYVQNELPLGAATDALAVFLAPHDRARFRAMVAGTR